MAVTLRKDAKAELIRLLRNQGYATYARLLGFFDIYLTDDPGVVGYMLPAKAKIVLNQNLTMDQVSTVVRHEILHEYLTHMERNKKFHDLNGKYLPIAEISNIAADFEISNVGYTEADKREMKRLKLNGQTLQGLVTELDRPGWENLTYEEMYKKLLDENEATKDALEDLLDRLSKLSQQDLDDLENQAEDIRQQNSESGESSDKKSTGASSNSSDESDKESDKQQGSGSETGKDGDESETADSSEDDKQGNKLDKLRKELADKADQLAGEIEQAKGKVAQMDEYQQSNGQGGFQSQDDQRDAVDVAARVAQISKMLGDLRAKSDMLDEVRINKQKERAIKAARDTERFRKSGLQQFKLALNRFIQNEIVMKKEQTYRRTDPRYDDTEFIMPGELETPSGHIPVINVYWDASGSFSDPAKTAAARRAIETLNKYVRSGDIKINVWYHGSRISDTYEGAGGGNRSNVVEEHVLQTRPDNVIVITDGDLSGDSIKATVPGAVWMLFYDTRSSGLMNSLHGKKETKYFDIEYR